METRASIDLHAHLRGKPGVSNVGFGISFVALFVIALLLFA